MIKGAKKFSRATKHSHRAQALPAAATIEAGSALAVRALCSRERVEVNGASSRREAESQRLAMRDTAAAPASWPWVPVQCRGL